MQNPTRGQPDEFRQAYKRNKSLFGLLVCLVFVWLPIDSKYFQIMLDAGLEDTLWAFWGMLFVGGVGVLGFAGQLLRPPLVLAAGPDGITIGNTWRPLEINLSPTNFKCGYRGALNPAVPWQHVRSIGVDRVQYHSGPNDTMRSEPALRIEFDESIDMSRCGDMLATQAGSKAYFEARPESSSVGWQEPHRAAGNDHIVLIGQQHFSNQIDRVCARLQTIMSLHAPRGD